MRGKKRKGEKRKHNNAGEKTKRKRPGRHT